MKKVFISMTCVLIALSGCTNGGSNKESMEVVLNIKRKVKPECVSALKEQKHGETAHLKQHLNEIKDMGDPSYKGSFRKIYVCPSVND